MLAAAALAAGTALAPALAAPAQADTPGCVSKAEYGKVRTGWSLARVHRLFDTAGSQIDYHPGSPGFPASQSRQYRGCPAYSQVQVVYDKRNGVWRVTQRYAAW